MDAAHSIFQKIQVLFRITGDNGAARMPVALAAMDGCTTIRIRADCCAWRFASQERRKTPA
jgi:hypothetical protein